MTATLETSAAPALWIGERDVVAAVSLTQAISAVRDAYRSAAAGEIVAMPKTVASWDGGTLHAIGALTTDKRPAGGGLAVAKTWAHTPGGATPLVIAWVRDTGRLIAVVEAFALGQLRTAAVCGAATAALAGPRCDVVGVLGTGKQAEGQVAAIAAVRTVSQIRVFSPTREHRVAFAARIAERSGIDTVAVGSVRDALDQASVVATVTRARQPIVSRPMLAPDVHINAVGAITAERAELEPAVVRAACRVVADDVAAARTLAPRECSVENAPHIVSLAHALANGVSRPDAGVLTIFKALGSGVSDLAVAELVIAHARAGGHGHELPAATERPHPQMWSDS